MNDMVELDTFRELLEQVDSYSKIIEIAMEIDESLPCYSENSRDTSEIYNSYGAVIHRLRNSTDEECEFDASILLEIAVDDFDDESPEYISVCLSNNNYSDTIVIQPEMNFDDYRKYKTFGMDFVPWPQLLNKTIKITKDVTKLVPTGYSLEEFALGHILWEMTFYGFSEEEVTGTSEHIEKLASGVDLSSVIEGDGDR
tara:strand:+ start:21887 stop:22483 length:597 start_codon:yes stop_codon:yes gene_type:complete